MWANPSGGKAGARRYMRSPCQASDDHVLLKEFLLTFLFQSMVGVLFWLKRRLATMCVGTKAGVFVWEEAPLVPSGGPTNGGSAFE